MRAVNTVGYGGAFPSMSVLSTSGELGVNTPAAPTQLTAAVQAGPGVALTWRDNAGNESGFAVERSADGGATYARIATAPARSGTGNVSFTDTGVTLGSTYLYRVAAENVAGASATAGPVTVSVAVPAAPANVTATALRQGANERVTVTWSPVPGATGYTVQRSADPAFGTVASTNTVAAGASSFTTGNIARQTWYFRVNAVNGLGSSDWSTAPAVPPAP